MTRRIAMTGLAIALVAAACGARSDRVTAPVDIPATLAPAVASGQADACLATTGTGLGARVTDTIPGTQGATMLASGDVIVDFGGTGITGASSLVAAVRDRRIGETIDVVLQSGETRQLTLQENPEAPGVPRLGVLVTTVDDTRTLDTIEPGSLDGPLVRVAQLDGRLWLFDPLTTTWRDLETGAPPALWIALDGDVRVLTIDLDNGGALVTSVISGTTVTVDLGDRILEGLFTSVADVLLVGTSFEDPDAPGTTLHTVTAIDPSDGSIRWAWAVPDDGDPRVQPSFGFRSPTGSMNLMALTPEDGLTSLRYLVLREVDGSPEAVPGLFPDDFVAIGWHDDTSVAGVVPPSISSLTIVDVTDGSTRTEPIPLTEVPVGLWPVGDGAHLIIEDGANLQVLDVGGNGRRLLTRQCAAILLSEPGWNR